MTAKRELYENVLKEVRESDFYVTPVTLSDVADDQVLDFDAESPFVGSLSAFSDYAVRDAILVEACEDETFSYVLVSKIVKTCQEADEANTFTQEHLEALSTVAHIAMMWEQEEPAEALINKIIPEVMADYNLEEPSLNVMNRRIINANNFPFAKTRKGMVDDLKAKIHAELELDVKEGAE